MIPHVGFSFPRQARLRNLRSQRLTVSASQAPLASEDKTYPIQITPFSTSSSKFLAYPYRTRRGQSLFDPPSSRPTKVLDDSPAGKPPPPIERSSPSPPYRFSPPWPQKFLYSFMRSPLVSEILPRISRNLLPLFRYCS